MNVLLLLFFFIRVCFSDTTIAEECIQVRMNLICMVETSFDGPSESSCQYDLKRVAVRVVARLSIRIVRASHCQIYAGPVLDRVQVYLKVSSEILGRGSSPHYQESL